MSNTSNVLLQVYRRELVAALGHLMSLTDRTASRPILANVHARAESGKLWLAATDYDTTLEVSVPVQGGERAEFLLPAREVAKVLRTWPDELLTATITPEAVTIACNGSQMPLPVVDVGLFPAPDSTALPARFTMHAAVLARAAESSVPFTIPDSTRRHLQGVHVLARKHDVRFEATDGHRLTQRDAPAEVGGKEALGECIVPAAALGLWQRVTKGRDGHVAVSWGDTHARFTLGDTTLTTRLIEGQFPALASVIPAKEPKPLAVEHAALLNAVKAVAAICREKMKPVGIRFQAGGLILASEPSDHGQIVQAVSARFDGETGQTGFNGAYMLDFLKLAKGGQVAIDMTKPLAPTRWGFSDDPSLVAVLMPLRIEFNVPDADVPAAPPLPKAPRKPKPSLQPSVSQMPSPQPIEAPVPTAQPEPAPVAPSPARIGRIGRSRADAIAHARSRLSPAIREIPSRRRSVPQAAAPAPAPLPQPEPTPAPVAQPIAEPQAKAKRKSPLTPQQRKEIAHRAVETRRRNAAMQAAS